MTVMISSILANLQHWAYMCQLMVSLNGSLSKLKQGNEEIYCASERRWKLAWLRSEQRRKLKGRSI